MKKSNFAYRGTRLVPMSAHKVFWDTIQSCPVPIGADVNRFYDSLSFLFLHIAERTGLTGRKMKHQVPVPYNWFRDSRNPARYALVYRKNPEIQAWLESVLIVTPFDYIKGRCREWQFKPSFERKFRKANTVDEPLYDITVRLRRRPKAKSKSDLIERSIVPEIIKHRIVRPANLRRGKAEISDLIERAIDNQRPYRFYLDRALDCLRNLDYHGKHSAYSKLWAVLERASRLGFKVVGGTEKDRIVEFYDQYYINDVGSRMFGISQAFLKPVKRLCFDHTYGTNYDMSQAHITILKELLEENDLEIPDTIHIDHGYLAKTLGVTRDTAKTLNFGGIYKGWQNQYKITVSIGDNRRSVLTPLAKALWKDSKVLKVLESLIVPDSPKQTELAQNAYVLGIWQKWKSIYKPAADIVSQLIDRLIEKAYNRNAVYSFVNDVECSYQIPFTKIKKERYSILSHYIQGRESQKLLEVLAQNLWCSAEFDGAIVCGTYNNCIDMEEKPFCTTTDAIRLFDKVWENGHTFKNDKRCIMSKTVSGNQENTVNRAYAKYYEKE
ncbi:hypothetical protein YOLOSWAG_213 [Erwinia phage vB_EamM_Yoloswag]|uniref:Uncharacterized protein n=1 Tax=Erwinia phage vB_EamM_Yoloswag TaxID=1958956 RepID=A0A1S6L3C5_9CAUD|nr:hypothetical protein HOR66_gp213 [Erwinia phage vB_EamM_Yoloswag]AQT28691.1 hypothetical protein YOLOSWAG_213 [Erwinia phage vB_EamM_Yoloswag]